MSSSPPGRSWPRWTRTYSRPSAGRPRPIYARRRTQSKTAQSQVLQHQSEKAAALAVVAQREAEFAVAKKRLARSGGLATSSVIVIQQLDEDRASALSAEAAIRAAESQVAAADAAIATARFQVIGTQSLVKASQASIERIQADTSDSALKSPRDGRVQYLVVRPGEVLGAACVFSLVFVLQGLLVVPIEGSVALFVAGTALLLFASTRDGHLHGHHRALDAPIRAAADAGTAAAPGAVRRRDAPGEHA